MHGVSMHMKDMRARANEIVTQMKAQSRTITVAPRSLIASARGTTINNAHATKIKMDMA